MGEYKDKLKKNDLININNQKNTNHNKVGENALQLKDNRSIKTIQLKGGSNENKVMQLKLNEEDSDHIWEFLTTNFKGEDDYEIIPLSERKRIHHIITQEASSRHQGMQMAMHMVKRLYKQRQELESNREPEVGVDSDSDSEEGYYGSDGAYLTLEEYNTLDSLVDAYNIILSGPDISRGMDSKVTTKIGLALGVLIKYIADNDLKDMLDLIICPGSSKETKPYAGLTFMQIIHVGETGFDCHNAVATALSECLFTLSR